MKPYGHRGGGDTGVTHYELGPDCITVRFQGGEQYLYDYNKPGRADVERMKALATAGHGLSTYINQHVRARYAAKLD
jgi:hypothetical protein